MQDILNYIQRITGMKAPQHPVQDTVLHRLPVYLRYGYQFAQTVIQQRPVIIAWKKHLDIGVKQVKTQLVTLEDIFELAVILGLGEIDAMTRRRLIDARVSFVIADNQLFLPDLFIDLRERYPSLRFKKESQTLSPSAQYLFLYYLLTQTGDPFAGKTMKQVAEELGYTPMTVTNAVEQLGQHGLCRIEGTREKQIRFEESKAKLWEKGEVLMNTPVAKKVYTDQVPLPNLRMTGEYALSAYSDLNQSRQVMYAITKEDYQHMEEVKLLKNPNPKEGACLLEIWKYNPEKLAALVSVQGYVDPLSLYLSLRDLQDERVQMALDQIKQKFIW